MTVNVFDYEAELSACALGDSSAFLNIYTHEAPYMLALLKAMLGNEQAAKEMLHDVFVAIWRNAAGYSEEIGTARAWIYSILRYKALAWQKGKNIDAELPQLNMPADTSPEKMPGALIALPEAKLNVLLQAYLHGGSTSSIADKLNRSEPDIKTTIESCLQHIDNIIQP